MSTTFCSAFKGFFQGNTILFVTWTFGIPICSYLGGSQRSRGVERYPPGLQEKETILEYISRKVNILEFLRPFKGVFKGVHSDSPSPPRRAFPNLTILRAKDLRDLFQKRSSLAFLPVQWKYRQGGFKWTARLVLPLIGEPSKPRLCVDDRFVHLWKAALNIFVYSKSFMTKLEDKGRSHSPKRGIFSLRWFA